MKTKEDLLDEVRNITKIKDLENMTELGVDRILTLIGAQRLNEQQIAAMIEVAPSFVALSVKSLETIATIVQEAGSSQRQVLENINLSIDSISTVLSILADKVESDETRLKIAEYSLKAGELYVEILKIQKDINVNNNNFWLKVGVIAASLVVVTAKIAALSIANSKSNSQ